MLAKLAYEIRDGNNADDDFSGKSKTRRSTIGGARPWN